MSVVRRNDESVILGTVQLGTDYGISNQSGQPTESTSFDILRTAWKAGIRVLDTSPSYGNAMQLIGKYHSAGETKFNVNSKFSELAAADLHNEVSHAVDVLNVSSLNDYFYHESEDCLEDDDVRGGLEELRQRGLIKSIGVSVYTNEEALRCAQMPHVDVIQLPFNLLDNMSQRGKVIEAIKRNGIRVQTRSVFLQGLFALPLSELPGRLGQLSPDLEKLIDIANSLNEDLTSLAARFAYSSSEVDEVLIGVLDKDQLIENLNLINERLPNDIVEQINAIRTPHIDLLNPSNW